MNQNKRERKNSFTSVFQTEPNRESIEMDFYRHSRQYIHCLMTYVYHLLKDNFVIQSQSENRSKKHIKKQNIKKHKNKVKEKNILYIDFGVIQKSLREKKKKCKTIVFF